MHYCIKVSLDDLLKGQSDELVLAVDKLLAEIADWDGVTISSPRIILCLFITRLSF